VTADVAVRDGRQVAWTSPIDWLPRALLEPAKPFRSIAIGWALAFPASILFAGLIHLIAPAAQQPQFDVNGALAVFLLVVFSPVVESLIMGAVLLILRRFLRPTRAVVASAAGWGIAHSLAAPIWGLVIWWPFLIFSTLFVVWRERSMWLAFGMPMAVHALQNLPPALLIAYAA
jgi:hypothetical protein